MACAGLLGGAADDGSGAAAGGPSAGLCGPAPGAALALGPASRPFTRRTMIELQGSRIDDTTGGNSGIERRVSLMYTRWCTQPRQVAGALCIHMAKIMGMYPRKGA